MITVRWTGSAKNEIYVRTLTGTPVTIKFTDDCDISTQTLQTVTKAIEEQTGLPEYRYTLIFAGQQIPTDSESLLRTLGHYSIGQSSTLHIVEKLRIAIYVKPASGDVITINFSDGPVSTQTLLTVMNLIHRQLGVPVLMQRLIFAGKTLPTDRRSVEKTLSHYNIQLRATLHLVQVSAYPADRYPAVPITLTIIKKDGKLGRECPMDGKELVIGRRAAPRPQPPRRLCASRSQRRQAAHAVSPRARRDPDDLRPEVSEVSERQAKILRNDEHGLVPLPASCARAESPPPPLPRRLTRPAAPPTGVARQPEHDQPGRDDAQQRAARGEGGVAAQRQGCHHDLRPQLPVQLRADAYRRASARCPDVSGCIRCACSSLGSASAASCGTCCPRCLSAGFCAKDPHQLRRRGHHLQPLLHRRPLHHKGRSGKGRLHRGSRQGQRGVLASRTGRPPQNQPPRPAAL